MRLRSCSVRRSFVVPTFPRSPDEIEGAVVEVSRRLREYGQEALFGTTSGYEAAKALRKATPRSLSLSVGVDRATIASAEEP